MVVDNLVKRVLGLSSLDYYEKNCGVIKEILIKSRYPLALIEKRINMF